MEPNGGANYIVGAHKLSLSAVTDDDSGTYYL